MATYCQYIIDATDTELSQVIIALSKDRISTYKKYVKQNTRKAVKMYDINLSFSALLFDLLHGFEITLRNKMHDALTTKYGSPLWFDNARFCNLLKPPSQQTLSNAKQRSVQVANTKPGQIIAELTFGFWTGLYASSYYLDLWKNHFEHLWPPAMKLENLRPQLDKLRRLRNRIAHHEPIFKNEHINQYKIILHLTKQLSPEIKYFFETRMDNKIADYIELRNQLL